MTEQPLTKWQKFKRFLKRNMTLTWFKHISYQIFAFLVSVAMVVGVTEYAVTKSYDAMKLDLPDGFLITAHTGAFELSANSLEFVQNAVEKNVQAIEIDVRKRPDGTLVMSHDLVVTNRDGVELEEALKLLKGKGIKLNLDIKEINVLDDMYKLLVKYDLVKESFLTGIEQKDIDAVKASECRDMMYYINYSPSRTKIFMEEYRQKILEMLNESGAVGLNCNYKYVGSSLTELLHSNGYKLSVWTIDTELGAKKMLAVSPDNITARNTEMVQSVIDNWGE